MIRFLQEQRLNERGTVFQKMTRKEAWLKIVAWVKAGSNIQAHLGFYIGASAMEGRYTKIQYRGTYIRFLDIRTAFNQFHLYYRDIVDAEFGEDADAGYQSITVNLRSKAFISITPAS